MLKNYDELIDLIHKNDKKIESLLYILTTKLSLVDIVNKKMSEGVLWRGISTDDVDHLNLTLALANRQVYENKLHDSKEFETKEEPPIKRGRNACELIERRKKYLLDLTHYYENAPGMDWEYARAMEQIKDLNELTPVQRVEIRRRRTHKILDVLIKHPVLENIFFNIIAFSKDNDNKPLHPIEYHLGCLGDYIAMNDLSHYSNEIIEEE